MLTKLLNYLVVLTVSEIFEVCDFLLNFLSLLDRVSVHQASTDISTESYSHQIIKTSKQTPKHQKQQSFPLKIKHSDQISTNLVKIQHLCAVSSKKVRK